VVGPVAGGTQEIPRRCPGVDPACGFSEDSSGIGLRIRGHPTDPPSVQRLMMISPRSAQEGPISQTLEQKLFIYRPLEIKTRFIAPYNALRLGPCGIYNTSRHDEGFELD
jgi:hypothetical protein